MASNLACIGLEVSSSDEMLDLIKAVLPAAEAVLDACVPVNDDVAHAAVVDETVPPPAHVVEHGLVWPPRWGAESFISFGEFADPTEAEARARLNGLVRSSEQRGTELTGATFTVCRVAALGLEVDVLLDANTHPTSPQPGEVIAGEVFLVADLGWLGFGGESAAGLRKRRWRRR
jgi:hypothetical protein